MHTVQQRLHNNYLASGCPCPPPHQMENAGGDTPGEVAVLRSLPDAEGQLPASKGKVVIPSPTEASPA
jgi:hypothetical protein